jgi:hypothetical protein
MTISINTDVSQTAGIPSQWNDDISVPVADLFTGDSPAPLTTDLYVAASQNIPALTPVGFDGSNRLIPAVSGVTPAIGILLVAVVTDASTNYKGAKVYRGGCFNPNRLNWPASYDTDDKKFAAFRGAPTPTQIILRAPKQHTIG